MFEGRVMKSRRVLDMRKGTTLREIWRESHRAGRRACKSLRPCLP